MTSDSCFLSLFGDRDVLLKGLTCLGVFRLAIVSRIPAGRRPRLLVVKLTSRFFVAVGPEMPLRSLARLATA